MIRESRGGEVGGMMERLRRYMSFVMVPLTIVLLFTERDIDLFPIVDITPALSSWMPLMRLDRAAGM